jgi:hypothetical protein
MQLTFWQVSWQHLRLYRGHHPGHRQASHRDHYQEKHKSVLSIVETGNILIIRRSKQYMMSGRPSPGSLRRKQLRRQSLHLGASRNNRTTISLDLLDRKIGRRIRGTTYEDDHTYQYTIEGGHLHVFFATRGVHYRFSLRATPVEQERRQTM